MTLPKGGSMSPKTLIKIKNKHYYNYNNDDKL